MQPYFFPYLGYFNLIHNVDLFIIYDVVQYLKRGWINRNRILHQDRTGWQYIVVPVLRESQKTAIVDIRVSFESKWREKIIGQLSHYKNKTANAEETIGFVRECLHSETDSISRLNTEILARCSNLLKIDFQYLFCSELDIDLDPARSAEERILDLCEHLGANEYVNLPGGVNLYHKDNFIRRGIKLSFLNLPTFKYQTGEYIFEADLSIIDLLMWNSPEEVKNYLNRHRDQQDKKDNG